MKKQQKNSILRAVLVIAFDLLLAGVLLLTFAFFHHVLPAIQSELESQRREEQLQQTQPPTTQPTAVPQATEPPTEATTEPAVTETEPTEPPVPKTEWQIKFADKFTDEVVVTENSYTSPYVSIHID